MEFVFEAQSLSQQNITVDVSTIPVVFMWGEIGEEMSAEMKTKLTANMVNLCGNMRIMHVLVSVVSADAFAAKIETAGDCYHLPGGRKKRQDGRPTARRFCRRCWWSSVFGKKRSAENTQITHLILGHAEYGC